MIDPNDPKRREVEDFITQYVTFWAFVCLASAILFVGWPSLLTWAAIFYGMRAFREAFFGTGELPKTNKPKRKPQCRK